MPLSPGADRAVKKHLFWIYNIGEAACSFAHWYFMSFYLCNKKLEGKSRFRRVWAAQLFLKLTYCFSHLSASLFPSTRVPRGPCCTTQFTLNPKTSLKTQKSRGGGGGWKVEERGIKLLIKLNKFSKPRLHVRNEMLINEQQKSSRAPICINMHCQSVR